MYINACVIIINMYIYMYIYISRGYVWRKTPQHVRIYLSKTYVHVHIHVCTCMHTCVRTCTFMNHGVKHFSFVYVCIYIYTFSDYSYI